MRIQHAALALGLAVAVVGCGKRPPQFTQVSGVLLLDGAPLPKAKIEFQPQLDNFGADMNSWAITDDEGKFTLVRNFTEEPGAAVGMHRVLVSELPTPGEFRSPDPQVQAKFAQYMAKLKNRPIPESYGKLLSAIEVEVKPDQKEYKIELKR